MYRALTEPHVGRSCVSTSITEGSPQDWWKKLWHKDKAADSEAVIRGQKKATDKARWLAADDLGNPFGVELLDLMVTQTVLGTSNDPAVAKRSASWGTSSEAALDVSPVLDRPAITCALRLRIDRSLPEGLLFTPASMDEKWVIAWRDGHVIAARSWTGVVDALADARLEGSTLVADRIRTIEASAFGMFGAVPQTFEWFLRCHALREKLPFPVDDDGARLLENAPLTAFSVFGNIIFCAAKSWRPPPSTRPLRSDGRIIRASRSGDLDGIERAVADGEDIDAPAAYGGYTALHISVLRGDTKLLECLLALGADPNRRAENGMFALGIAIVHEAPPELFAALERAAVDMNATNDDGFNALHAACKVGNASAVRWLVERGHPLEPRTKRGYTPLQFACALGHLDAAQTMVELGADVDAQFRDSMALDIAKREGKVDVVAWLVNRR